MASIMLVSAALFVAACGSDGTSGVPGETPADGPLNTSGPPNVTDALTPSPGAAVETSVEVQEPGPEPGDVSLPDAKEVADLPKTERAEGLILVTEDAMEGCVILTYHDGELHRLGTFAQTTVERRPAAARPCSVRRYYSSDFSFRVNDIHPLDAGPDGTDHYVVVQQIDQEEEDISAGRNLRSPVVGPDDNVYVRNGAVPSVMGKDGTGLREVPNGVPDPDWLSGQMLGAGYKGSANADGSLAVFLVKKNLYSVESLMDREAREYVAAGEGEFLEPLAWAGEDQFLTSSGATIFLNTVVQGDGEEKPTISSEPFATVPEAYSEQVKDIQLCKDVAYFTQNRGQYGLVPDQTVLLGVNLDDGEMTAHLSIVDGAGDQSTMFRTTLLDCIQ